MSMKKAPTAAINLRTVLIVTTILLTGLGAMTTNCADPDLWGHVQYGREVLRDGALPHTTTWSFAAEGAQWVNHENIAELLLAWTVNTFGMSGLPVMKLALAVVILGLMTWSARHAECSWLSIAVTILVVANCLQFHWHFRPQILSYVCLAAMLAIWQRAFYCPDASFSDAKISTLQRQMRTLWLMPPLLCLDKFTWRICSRSCNPDCISRTGVAAIAAGVRPEGYADGASAGRRDRGVCGGDPCESVWADTLGVYACGPETSSTGNLRLGAARTLVI